MRSVSFAGIFILGLTLAGCATTKKEMSIEQLQMRISDMENQVEQKSLEIQDLKDQMSDLKDELKKTNVATVTAPHQSMAKSSMSKDVIRVAASPHDVQSALKNAGFYTGPIDGKVGDKTKNAIKSFQEANSLAADGVLGQKTWDKLKTYLN